MKWRKQLTYLCLGSLVLVLCIFFGFITWIMWANSKDEEKTARLIADRFGINEQPSIVKQYVYCDLLIVGMPITEVEANLDKIDSFRVYRDNNVKKYVFDDPNIAYLLGEIHITYDNNLLLIEKGKREGFGDYKPFDCY